MILRVVKMTILPQETERFARVFQERRDLIAAFEGCLRVDLLKTTQADEAVFFTLSYWQHEENLETYRQSSIFKETWSIVKPLFAQKAQAWTLTGVTP